jgi:hypothetical protein
MPQFTEEERIWLVESYQRSYGIGRNGGPSLKQVKVNFSEHYHKNPPTNRNLLAMVRKFRLQGTIRNLNNKNFGRPRNVKTNDNTERVFDKVLLSPKKASVASLKKLSLISLAQVFNAF